MKKSTLQIWTTIVLLAIPLFMIWLHGHEAINALLWKKPVQSQSINRIDQKQYKAKQELNFGIYDPYNSWNDSTTVWDYKQLYINWLDFNETISTQKINSIQQKGLKVILIVEPWAKEKNTLFTDIVSGKYDAIIDRLKIMLNSFDDAVYICWGHEMDQDLTDRYDWSSKDSNGYIDAYKYVHTKLNSSSIYWIWAPVGKNNCTIYWPGDNYVDIVGLPIYAFPQFDFEYYGNIRSFQEAFDEKYTLIKQYDKPVFLLEFGVFGSLDFEAYWVKEAFESFHNFKLLNLVVFFNSQDTEGAWGDDYTTPDWSVNQEIISAYIKRYRNLK